MVAPELYLNLVAAQVPNGSSRLLKNWGARLTLEHESDSCAVERAAGGIHARFGYTDR